MLVKMRVDVELNKYQLAALLWDGMNGRYSESALHACVFEDLRLTPSVIKEMIKGAVARHGEDSVSCGPSHDWSEDQSDWCAQQVARIFRF